MGLETANTITGLNAAWPTGTDLKSQGDDHLRLIKAALQHMFPTPYGDGPVSSWIASVAQAQAATDNVRLMTPARVESQITGHARTINTLQKFTIPPQSQADPVSPDDLVRLSFLDNRPVVVYSGGLTIASGTVVSFTHNKGFVPTFMQCALECMTAEHGWAVGDSLFPSIGGNALFAPISNKNIVQLRFSNAASCFSAAHKTSGAPVNLTNANWRAFIIAGF